jgi:hypothetical protein
MRGLTAAAAVLDLAEARAGWCLCRWLLLVVTLRRVKVGELLASAAKLLAEAGNCSS